MGFHTVSTAAREITRQTGCDVSPRSISLLLYRRELPDDAFPIVAGRRLIPSDRLPDIIGALQQRGELPEGATA